jgi:hypothetical protein
MIEHPWPAFYAGGVESLFAQALSLRFKHKNSESSR